jgi:hypothetical protein
MQATLACATREAAACEEARDVVPAMTARGTQQQCQAGRTLSTCKKKEPHSWYFCDWLGSSPSASIWVRLTRHSLHVPRCSCQSAFWHSALQ